jgi:hypothetical protein
MPLSGRPTMPRSRALVPGEPSMETEPVKPYRIRFMSEVGCDFALWGDPFRPLPDKSEYGAGDLERVLPISEELRTRILAWADRYRQHDD